jgi:aryl-alcohol dehydrogenase-like predicted oxidoreductase
MGHLGASDPLCFTRRPETIRYSWFEDDTEGHRAIRYRRLGSSELVVSEIGFGTWQSVSRQDQRRATDLVRTALDLGMNLIDTADSYGDAQQALRVALDGVERDRYLISTKVFFDRAGSGAGSLSRERVLASATASLRELGVEELDLLSAHRFDPGTPVAETVAAFGELIAAGTIRCYGLSEWTAAQITEACQVADELSVPRPVANQPQYNALWRVPEGLVMPACRRLGLGSVVFWPLAQGILTGKYLSSADRPDGSRAATDLGRSSMSQLMLDPVLDRVQLFARVAARLSITPAQLAIAWTLHNPQVNSALIGASRATQLIENVAAVEVRLSDKTLALIDKVLAGCVIDDVGATG